MDDEGFAGIISEETHHGILTHTDSEYNYVWAPHLKTLELRFPLNPQLAFQPGDSVRFLQQKDGRGPQIVHDLVKEKDYKLEVVRETTTSGTVAWKAKVNMVFAPQNNARLRKMKEIEENVQWLAFTDNFLEVLCFLKDLDVVPGVVYEGYVTRLPEPFIVLGKKMGSLFCVRHRQGTPFNKIVTDTKEIEELMARCPFANEVTINEDADIGLPTTQPRGESVPNQQLNSSNTTTQHGAATARDNNQLHENFLGYEDDLTIDFAAKLEDLQEGSRFLGLIVRTADEYAVIWSPTHDLVRIQLPSGAELHHQQYNIATWVHYRCFEEQSQLHNAIRCSYTAYDISSASRDDRLVSTCTTEYGTEVIMQCFLSDPREHNEQLFHASDSFVGQIICPHDRWLKEQVQKMDSVQVMAIFTAELRRRWMAFAMEKQKDVYQKLDGLPPVIDAKVQPFFNRVGSRKTMAHDEQVHLMNVGARFKPPLDWKGPRECGNTVVSVLGVTIGSERNGAVCVIATSYGIARQPKHMELGTWVEATIQAESDEQAVRTVAYESFMHAHTYRVLKSRKIQPPMSTRVVTKRGAERLLLCGDVKCVVNGLRNDYLGRVEDTKHHVDAKPGESYLVELGITRQPENQRNCLWSVLKCHGKSVKNVLKVPLQLSVHTAEEGKTCDDAHRILIDPTYDANEHAWNSVPNVPHYELTDRNKRLSSSSSSSLETMATTAAAAARRENYWTKQQQQQWVEFPAGDTSSNTFDSNRFRTMTTTVAHSAEQQQPRQPAQQKQQPPIVKRSPYDVSIDEFTVNRKAAGAPLPPLATSSSFGGNTAGFEKMTTTAPTTNNNKSAISSPMNYVDASDNDDVVLTELARYEPSTEKKHQGHALVVRKRPQYILMYTPKYGLCIVLPKYADVQSACEFDEKFSLGEFYSCSFVRVAEREERHLTYEWMCKGDFKLISPMLKTRLIMGRFVHVNVCCEFTNENMTKTHGEHLILKTDLGNVRLGKDFLLLNDLSGKTASVWVAYVKEIEGCHWEIVQESWGTLMDDEPPQRILDTQSKDHSVVAAQKNHVLQELHNKLNSRAGYVDFLFGSGVCDGMSGERYHSQRYGMTTDSDEEDALSDSDADRPVDNWDDSATTSENETDDLGALRNSSARGFFDAADDDDSDVRLIGGASPPRPHLSLLEMTDLSTTN